MRIGMPISYSGGFDRTAALIAECGSAGLGVVPDTFACFAIGPRNVAMAAEPFENWQPALFMPEGSGTAFSEAVSEGSARRDPELGPLQISAYTTSGC